MGLPEGVVWYPMGVARADSLFRPPWVHQCVVADMECCIRDVSGSEINQTHGSLCVCNRCVVASLVVQITQLLTRCGLQAVVPSATGVAVHLTAQAHSVDARRRAASVTALLDVQLHRHAGLSQPFEWESALSSSTIQQVTIQLSQLPAARAQLISYHGQRSSSAASLGTNQHSSTCVPLTLAVEPPGWSASETCTQGQDTPVDCSRGHGCSQLHEWCDHSGVASCALSGPASARPYLRKPKHRGLQLRTGNVGVWRVAWTCTLLWYLA